MHPDVHTLPSAFISTSPAYVRSSHVMQLLFPSAGEIFSVVPESSIKPDVKRSSGLADIPLSPCQCDQMTREGHGHAHMIWVDNVCTDISLHLFCGPHDL